MYSAEAEIFPCRFCARWKVIFFYCRLHNVPFKGTGVSGRRFLPCSSVFFDPSAIVSLTAGLCMCVCVFVIFLLIRPCLMPSAQWPMLFVWGAWQWPWAKSAFCLSSQDKSPCLAELRTRGSDRSLAHWESVSETGWGQVPVVEAWGGSFSCITDFWQTINRIAKTAEKERDCLKGN